MCYIVDIVKPQKRRRKKEATTPVPQETKGAHSIPDLNGGNPGPKKRRLKEGTLCKCSKPKSTIVFPDANGSNAKRIPLEVCLQEMEPGSPAASIGLTNNADAGSVEADKNCSKTNLLGTSPLPCSPIKGADTPTAVLKPCDHPIGEVLSLVDIRQNLELMTSMLEKYGDNLSAKMRAKSHSEESKHHG
ncbi:hypothetical protein Ancab_017541 [Ancistrocladus abbreviatus]